jgi:hypothetical protein
MGPESDACVRVEQGPVARGDAACVGHQQPRDGVDDGRLARPGAAEEHRHPRRRAKRGVERETPEGMADRDLQHYAPPTRVATRRPISSDSRSAPMATTTETITSFIADPSPPGT